MPAQGPGRPRAGSSRRGRCPPRRSASGALELVTRRVDVGAVGRVRLPAPAVAVVGQPDERPVVTWSKRAGSLPSTSTAPAAQLPARPMHVHVESAPGGLGESVHRHGTLATRRPGDRGLRLRGQPCGSALLKEVPSRVNRIRARPDAPRPQASATVAAAGRVSGLARSSARFPDRLPQRRAARGDLRARPRRPRCRAYREGSAGTERRGHRGHGRSTSASAQSRSIVVVAGRMVPAPRRTRDGRSRSGVDQRALGRRAPCTL